jgi:8-oxo-dGTP pyrophosphatase MutT (NUDIX family)
MVPLATHPKPHEPVQLMLDAVIAVITKGEKVLLIQRAPGIRGGGYWAPVSGEVEPGESQEAAVAREAMEEVGFVVRPIRKVGRTSRRGELLDCTGGSRSTSAVNWRSTQQK